MSICDNCKLQSDVSAFVFIKGLPKRVIALKGDNEHDQ